MRLKFHGAQICIDTCGNRTSLVKGKFVDDLRPMQEQADQQDSSRRFFEYVLRLPPEGWQAKASAWVSGYPFDCSPLRFDVSAATSASGAHHPCVFPEGTNHEP
jgi:hypothetical protein